MSESIGSLSTQSESQSMSDNVESFSKITLINDQKNKLRQMLKEKRAKFSYAQKTKLSDQLSDNLLSFIELRKYKRIFAFRSSSGEPDINRLIDAICNEYEVFLPVVTGPSTMEFQRYSTFTQLKPNRFGIFEPVFQKDKKLKLTDDDLILVPGLGFGRKGERLGYGGGFYDRYLALKEVFCLGVCFSEFICDHLPTDEHDQMMNALVTQDGLIALPERD